MRKIEEKIADFILWANLAGIICLIVSWWAEASYEFDLETWASISCRFAFFAAGLAVCVGLIRMEYRSFKRWIEKQKSKREVKAA